ncbi:hypothetical protein HUB98_03620 [Paenibacillus barcinonensis]|uniref:Uncharacterized protein n=1 Tax=Paenibacillus barcinonensis TaxID=198119 RepID=A0A2V4VJH1_PAEBA|nr:hypothetical protein [Paenibacillus barcinonensis]PYE49264.1 hypothetical protein DFQ00_106247 [Paenibacillus barcinonensis]QKS55495.1 hypothetical protein HUB98_03620 [Paenibacillus barcinonensis]
MRTKCMLSTITAVIVSVILLGVTFDRTSKMQTSEDDMRRHYTDLMEPLPASLVYDSEHPDEIYIKDCGVFVKTKEVLNDYSGMVVAHDVQQVTKETTILVAYDGQYIKQSEWK